MNFRFFFAAILAATATLTAVGPALAQPVESRTVEVHVGDLDLKTEQGVARLDGRVRNAVSTVCGNLTGHDLNERAEIAGCRTGAFAMAKPQVDRLLAAAQGSQLAMLEIR